MIPSEHEILPSISFKGEAQLEGYFQFTFRNGDGGDFVSLDFFPTKSSVEKLPYFDRQDYERPNRIEIFYPKKVAPLFVGSDLAAKLFSGEIRSIGGTAVISIKNYIAAYACDTPGYGAEISEVERIVDLSPKEMTYVQAGC